MSDGRRRRDPTPVGDVIDEVLGRLARRDVAPLVRLGREWPDVAGEWADRCRPVSLAEGTLTLAVASGLDASRLRYETRTMVEAVNRVLGEGVVTRISVRVSAAHDPPG